MSDDKVNKLTDELKSTQQELKVMKGKVDTILDLVYKTFTGNSEAAKELSLIVGVPAPVLFNEEEECEKVNKAYYKGNNEHFKDTNNTTGRSPRPDEPSNNTNGRLHSRMDFLNQVIDDHERLVGTGGGRRGRDCNSQASLRKPKSNSNLISRSRVKSAERSRDQFDRSVNTKYQNPYSWNLNDHVNDCDQYFYKPSTILPIPHSHSKPIIDKLTNKPIKSHQNQNMTNMKVENFLYNSSNKRKSHLSKSEIRPDTDFNAQLKNPTSILLPPSGRGPGGGSKSSLSRPMSSSLSYNQRIRKIDNASSRTTSAAHKRNNNNQKPRSTKTSYQQLSLQTLDDSKNSNTEELLRILEKKFELSTIELQRRLGISHEGMVGL